MNTALEGLQSALLLSINGNGSSPGTKASSYEKSYRGYDHEQENFPCTSVRLSSWNDSIELTFSCISSTPLREQHASLTSTQSLERSSTAIRSGDTIAKVLRESLLRCLYWTLSALHRGREDLIFGGESTTLMEEKADPIDPYSILPRDDVPSISKASRATSSNLKFYDFVPMKDVDADTAASDLANYLVGQGRKLVDLNSHFLDDSHLSLLDADLHQGENVCYYVCNVAANDDPRILLTELLRAMKNLVRLCNLYNDMKGMCDTIASLEADVLKWMERFRSRSMLRLYLALLSTDIFAYRGSLVQHERRDDEEAVKAGPTQVPAIADCHPKITNYCDEISRYAAIVILHSLRGSGKAVQTFLSFDDDNGIVTVIREFVRPIPARNVIALVRILHNLIALQPKILCKMNSVLSKVKTSLHADGHHAERCSELTGILVATLAWTIRSSPPFPGKTDSDRRADLAEEILQTLFAINSSSPPCSTSPRRQNRPRQQEEDQQQQPEQSEETLTQIGMLLCDILCLPNADARVYRCKLQVVNLLMDSPPQYGFYLLMNGGIKSIMTILWLQLNAVVVEKRGMGDRNQDTVLLLPILAVLIRFTKERSDVKEVIKNEIFPSAPKTSTVSGHASIYRQSTVDNGNEELQSRHIAAADAPEESLQGKLIRLMTWSDSSVKRLASEFLWTLCDENQTEFVIRIGFGNAVHFLSTKGLVRLPVQSH